jgi:hypothetical protein
MASVNDRLGRLEARRAPPCELPVYLSLYLKELENIERDEERKSPILLTPAEEAQSKEGDRWFLEEYIPHARALGLSPESLETINELEAHAREGR